MAKPRLELVPDILSRQAQRRPDQVAVALDGGASLTFGQWEAGANALARTLLDRSVLPGDRVGLLVSNDDVIEFVQAWLAIHKAGGVAVPLNPRLTAHELEALCVDCDPRLIVTGRELSAPAGRPALTWAQIVEAAAHGDTDPIQVARSADDLADILYTSGTTGLPKGVACTHASVAWSGGGGMEAAFAGASFLHAIPLCTFAGTHAMTLIPLRSGMTSHVMRRFDAARFIELLAAHQVRVTYAVPSMLLLMLERPELTASDLSALRLLMYGTAPMPAPAIVRLSEALPTTMLLNLYGLTEGGGAVCMLPPHEAKSRPGSLGKPMPPTEARIVDDEIQLKPPVAGRSYFGGVAAGEESPWTEDGWLKTGDLGRIDDDGYLYLVDRKKDLIIRGGFNVSAPEVEAALVAHPDVVDAAVVGVPHSVLGEDTLALVVLREGVLREGVLRDGAAATAAELETFLRERLADFKVPRTYHFRTDLPRNALGKVLKRVLREEAQA
jgi:acyl-CoA synthetase (AMP-forming)/AMP-acid ligase II